MNKLERDLMSFLIPQCPYPDILAEQVRHSIVSSREYSGAGFFTNFEVSPDAPAIPGREKEDERMIFGLVHISSSELEHGGGAIIFMEKGRLGFLEGYAYGDNWPQRELIDYTLSDDPSIKPNQAVDSTAGRVTPPASSLRSGQESRHGQP